MTEQKVLLDMAAPHDGGCDAVVSRADLTALMTRIGRSLAAEPLRTQDLVERITWAAAETVPGAEHASIAVLTSDGHLPLLAYTDPVAAKINDLQTELRQGPRFDTDTAGQGWMSGDIAADGRWPLLGPAIAELGVRSLLSTAIASEPQRVVLNLFSSRRDAFKPHDVAIDLFAHHARLVLGYAVEVDSLHRALESRTIIGEAIGLMMARYGLNEPNAFQYLVRMSQNNNVKVREVALNVVRSWSKDK